MSIWEDHSKYREYCVKIVQILENVDQKNSVLGHFLHSESVACTSGKAHANVIGNEVKLRQSFHLSKIYLDSLQWDKSESFNVGISPPIVYSISAPGMNHHSVDN